VVIQRELFKLTLMLQAPLLHSIVCFNAHPHRELAESVRLLIEAGADIDAAFTDSNGVAFTAVMFAAESMCCTAKAAALLQAGANPCAHAPGSVTALHRAARAGLAETCELLLSRADGLLEARDVQGRAALRYAAANGRVHNVEVLLQHGSDVNSVDNNKRTPLYGACLNKDMDVATRLLEAGADVNAVDVDRESVLLAAVQSGSTPLVQLLLDHGAKVNCIGHHGQNAVFKAAHMGHVSMLELLAQRGLSLTTVDDDGVTALMAAVLRGRKPAAEWLLQHGAAVNAARRDGCTALHCACAEYSGVDAAMVELLLANGADVHMCNDLNRSALDVAMHYGHLQCAEALVAAGINVNNTNNEGNNTLHIAVRGQHTAAVQLLLDSGATAVMNRVVPAVCENCCYTSTALMMCTDADTVKALLAAGADVHVTADSGDTCLHTAAVHGLAAPVLCLLIKFWC
jgi:ankyrin repeat protein